MARLTAPGLVVVIFERRFVMREATEPLVLSCLLLGVSTGGIAPVEVSLSVDDLALEAGAY